MSWNCNNTCHIITNNHARRIIAANSPLTLPLVEFVDLDGSRFHVDVSDAPCLKIVIDLKDGGGNVLQDIGILIDNLAVVRNTIYFSDALQEVRCKALCSVPFSVQLSNDIELIVCEASNPCPSPKPINNYLMLIAFFLGLLLLLYFLSLLCYFWRQWYPDPCNLCRLSQNKVNTAIAPTIVPNSPVIIPSESQVSSPAVIINPEPECPNPPVITNPEPECPNPPVITNPETECPNPPVITNPEPEVSSPQLITNPELEGCNFKVGDQFLAISSRLEEIQSGVHSINVLLSESKAQNPKQLSAVLVSDSQVLPLTTMPPDLSLNKTEILSTVMLPSDLKPDKPSLILSDLQTVEQML